MQQIRASFPASFSHKKKQPLTIRLAIYTIGIVIAGLIALSAYANILWAPNNHAIVLMLLKFGWIMPLLFGSFICLTLLSIALAAHIQWCKSHRTETALKMDEPLRRLRYARAESIAHFGTYEIRLLPHTSIQTSHWSDEMYRILEHAPSQGAPTTDQFIDTHVMTDDREYLKNLLRHAFECSTSIAAEYRIQCKDNTTKHVYDYLEFIREDLDGKLFFGQLHDITERKLIEVERLESAAGYQRFVEGLGGTQYIATMDKQGGDIYIGENISALLGFSQEEWCKDQGIRFKQMHDEDISVVEKAIEQHVLTHEPLSIDYRIYGRDGTLRWFHDESRVVKDIYASPLFRQGVIFDITARKQAQEELAKSHEELKELIGALDAMREEEQKRLAREMHDDLGQLLAAMKMDLCDLQQYLPQNDTKATERMQGVQELVATMVISVRRIIADLPPKMLEDLGLFPALLEMTANFEKRHQIRCSLRLPAVEIMPDQRSAATAYRMVQEALNNVARHAAATHVEIKFDVSDGNMIVTVSDNGSGMMIDAPRKADSFGLIGIRERVTALRGELKIASTPGMGTIVCIELPLDSSSTDQRQSPEYGYRHSSIELL